MWYVQPYYARLHYIRSLPVTQNPGQTTYASSVGFMSPNLDAIHLIMTSILSLRPWLRDPNVVPMLWRGDIVDATLARVAANGTCNGDRRLKFGMFRTDGMVTPHPPIQRGLRLVEEAIKKAGHIVSLQGYDKSKCLERLSTQ